MIPEAEFLRFISDRHARALQWFLAHSGEIGQWPKPLPDGTLLASRAKGIYKPNWSEFALSIRSTIGSPYPDDYSVSKDLRSWSILYAQEGASSAHTDQVYTNRALFKCMASRVPVGVFRQVASEPISKYEVLGIARVESWSDGFFLLAGINADFSAANEENVMPPPDLFNPTSLRDARERIQMSIVVRRGQPAFRSALLDAYNGVCALTDCEVTDVLEACHIVPFMGDHTNHPSNGILLRSDLHTLFDSHLIAIDSKSKRLLMHDRLKRTQYASLEGSRLKVPTDDLVRPSDAALMLHRRWAKL